MFLTTDDLFIFSSHRAAADTRTRVFEFAITVVEVGAVCKTHITETKHDGELSTCTPLRHCEIEERVALTSAPLVP